MKYENNLDQSKITKQNIGIPTKKFVCFIEMYCVKRLSPSLFAVKATDATAHKNTYPVTLDKVFDFMLCFSWGLVDAFEHRIVGFIRPALAATFAACRGGVFYVVVNPVIAVGVVSPHNGDVVVFTHLLVSLWN